MNLRKKVLSGLYWTGGARLLGQAITWAITIAVIRLLTPEDYGLLAMATVFVGFLVLLSEAGLGAALVQAPELDTVKLSGVFAAVIVVNSFFFITLFGAAPVIGDFFDEHRLANIIRALALQFLLSTFSVIPTALLTRKLDFKRQSLIGLFAGVLGSIGTLVLALYGFGVWSLIIGTLFTQLFTTLAINIVCPYLKWPRFSMSGMSGLLTFGGQLTAARILWFLYSRADIFIAGKLLGKESLGFYSVPLHLASLPVQKISAIINQITFSAFARVQDNPKAIGHYVLKALRILSFVSFPTLWGISSIAPEFVAVVLGPNWGPAVVPLLLLPLVMPLSMVGFFLNTALQGVGRGREVFGNVLTACLIMPAAFWIGAHWGILGLAVAWIVGFPFVLVLNLRRILPLLGLTWSQFWSALAPSALGSSGMYGGVLGAKYLIADSLAEPLLLALLIAIGCACYLAFARITNRSGLAEIIDLVSFRRAA